MASPGKTRRIFHAATAIALVSGCMISTGPVAWGQQATPAKTVGAQSKQEREAQKTPQGAEAEIAKRMKVRKA